MDHREKIERYSFQLLYFRYLFEHEYLTQDEYIQILKKLKSDYQVCSDILAGYEEEK